MQQLNTPHFSTSTPTPNSSHISELIQPNGLYEGELEDNLREGLGIFIWQNGDSYFGQWTNNEMHGKGVFCFNTGHYVEGSFVKGLVSGAACLTYPDGSFIKGVFINGELQGRVIHYQAEKDNWFLHTYEAGRHTGTHYEGSGKPMTFDFCVNIYQEDLEGFSTRSVDNNYRTKNLQKESETPDSLGCFEIDAETRHFGVIKNNRIAGLGLRIKKKVVEVGKYRDGNLEGYGRRLEFGNMLYEGEFLQGRPYGKGALYQWREKTLTVGVFTSGTLMQKMEEKPFSLQDLDKCSSSQVQSEKSQVLKMAVRSYEDAFTKKYPLKYWNSEDPNALMTTIKEIEYAKVFARETIIEQQPTKQVTRGMPQIVENPNIIRHKRSHSSESPSEVAFSPTFSFHVNTKQQALKNNYRSVSRDSARSRTVSSEFIQNKANSKNQALKEPGSSLMSNGFSALSKVKTTEANSRSTIPTFGLADEKDYPSVGDLIPQVYSSIGSPECSSQASSAINPFGGGLSSYLNFIVNSPGSKKHQRHNSNLDIVSSALSMTSKKELNTSAVSYQQKKLNKDRKASKSISGLQSCFQIPFDLKQITNPISSSPYTYGVFGIEKRTSSTSGSNHKQTLSTAQSPSDIQGKDWSTIRSPSSSGFSTGTPTKKANESPNKTSGKGNKLLSQILAKKGTGSTSSTSVNVSKKTDVVEKGASSTDKQHPFVYVGSSFYSKKPTILNSNSKCKDVSPLSRPGSSLSSVKKDTVTKLHKRETSINGVRSPGMNKLMQVQSPSTFSNVTLPNEKVYSQRKEVDGNSSYTILSKDRSATPLRTPINTNISPRISAFTLDTTDSKQAAPKSSRESYANFEEKLSTRSKSPLVTNVNLDLTMFRPKTPVVSEADNQRTSAGNLIFGRDPSPLSYRESASPIGHINEQQAENQIKFDNEAAMQAARFSFLPAREDQYRSGTSKDQNGDGKFDSLLPDFVNKEEGIQGEITGPNTNISEDKGHRRAVSQVEFSQFEKEKLKALNSRYKGSEFAVPTRKLDLESNNSSDNNDIVRPSSPYKIDVQQERRNSRSRSPQGDRIGANSPLRHSHESIDSHSSGYPVKKTCNPNSDPCYNELRNSGYSQKGSSQRGSSARNSQELNAGNLASLLSPRVEGEQKSVKENAVNSEGIPQEHKRSNDQVKVSITDIFRKSLNMVQNRVESSDDGHFDLKAIPTVNSRYENCSDSRTFQKFPTRSSCKATENSPEISPLTSSKLLPFKLDSVIRKSDAQKEVERVPISQIVAEVAAIPSPNGSEPDLGTRIESCLAQTRANIEIIEKMNRDGKDTKVTGTKRMKLNEVKSAGVRNVNTLGGSSGNDNSGIQSELKSNLVKYAQQGFMLDDKESDPQSSGASTRGGFTFREQKDMGSLTDQLLDEMINEGNKKLVKHFRSNSLSKPKIKIGGTLVKKIALYNGDEVSEENVSKDKGMRGHELLKEARVTIKK